MIFFLLAVILFFIFFGGTIVGFFFDYLDDKELKASEMSGFILDPNSVKKEEKENLNIEEI